jgi:uncharacterized protein
MPRVNSFTDPFAFRPLPMLGNPHVQTLVAHLLPAPSWSHPTRTHILRLPDGDATVLYDTVSPSWSPTGPIAVIVHGLTGSHASSQIQRLARFLLPFGWRVVRLDLRGARPSLALSRQTYHGGRSQDVRAALEEVHRWSPASPITAVGYSLGGNLVLKMAGEAADSPIAGLSRIAALAPPINLARCAFLITQPRNRLYNSYFVRELVRDAQQRRRFFPDLPQIRFQPGMTLHHFDDQYTAAVWGFADSQDYYKQSSSAALLSRIKIPTFIMTARDDPFIAVEMFDDLRLPAHVRLRIVPKGGHLGFLGWDGTGGYHWADRRVAEWIVSGDDTRGFLGDAS